MKAPRLLGIATVGYSAAVLVRPALLLNPTGLADSRELRIIVRLVALRDLASGSAMAWVTEPSGLRTAIAVRVGSDLADAVVLGIALRGRSQWAKAVAVPFAWAVLCASSARAIGRRRYRPPTRSA